MAVKKTAANNRQSSKIFSMLGLGAVSLAIAYGFASWAIDSGSLWHYFLTLVSLSVAVRFFVRAFNN